MIVKGIQKVGSEDVDHEERGLPLVTVFKVHEKSAIRREGYSHWD